MELRQRFDSGYTPVTESGCWLWDGALVSGYGVLKIDGRKLVKTHRLSYVFYRGEIPDGLFVCHKCDVRCCVNPDHLFLGTNRDNALDMTRKGRNRGGALLPQKGEKNGSAKIRAEDVETIRSSKDTTAHLAEAFGLSKAQINRIRAKTRWA